MLDGKALKLGIFCEDEHKKVAYERTAVFTIYATVGIIIATLVVDIKEIGLTKNKC